MVHVVTSNQLTAIHGDSPLFQKPLDGREFKRGFIVYLEVFGTSNRGGVYARTFYKDFDSEIPDQEAFEDAVIAKAIGTGFDERNMGNEWPGTFAKTIKEIRFGWRPCKVTYILNSDKARFIVPPDRPQNGTHHHRVPQKDLMQPIIFRRDKIVYPTPNTAEIEQYHENHSFYNLEVFSSCSYPFCSLIRFDNFMFIDRFERELGEPPADDDAKSQRWYPYCMDVHIVVEQMKMLQAQMDGEVDASQGLGNESVEEVELIDVGSIEGGLVIVFDPPQGNGGTGGPPGGP